MPLCDICSRHLDYSQGYALTTEQVVSQSGYWAYMLEQHTFDDELYGMFVHEQMRQTSGWLVCETCKSLFDFEPLQARMDARLQRDPINGGAVDLSVAGVPAARAWYQKYRRLPTWVKTDG